MFFKRSAAVALSALFILGGCKAKDAADTAVTKLPPQPPIWVVSDADSEITLYPTIHILPADVEWKSDELTRRMAEAEEVWFEILPGSENDPALQQAMITLGMEPGSSLSSKLSPEEVAALEKAVAPLRMPIQAIDQMKPWLVSTFVTVGALIDKGFDPNAGVEKQLQPLTEGKKIRALETAEGQMRMMSSIPEEEQMEMLRQSLLEMDEGIDVLKDLVTDWSVGDVEDMEDELLDDMKAETPAVYNILITTRNKNWVEQIETEMKGSGTDFIAVGAAHLVGEDGVPAMLEAKGYTVTRL